MEWKLFRSIHQRPAISKDDLRWLRSFTNEQPGAIGYAVAIDLEARNFRAEVASVVGGEEKERWQVPRAPAMPSTVRQRFRSNGSNGWNCAM